MMKSINDIQNCVNDLGKLINAPENKLQILTNPTYTGDPYVEIINSEYHYACSERGSELFRKKSKNLDDLLYWIFRDLIFSLSTKYELSHRTPYKDTRRIIFQHQVDLFNKINKNWTREILQEIEDILKKYPYND